LALSAGGELVAEPDEVALVLRFAPVVVGARNFAHGRSPGDSRTTAARHDPPVAVKLVNQVFAKLLSWMMLHARSDTTNEIEILVLRHQLTVL
jgi:hypothetical protein